MNWKSDNKLAVAWPATGPISELSSAYEAELFSVARSLRTSFDTLPLCCLLKNDKGHMLLTQWDFHSLVDDKLRAWSKQLAAVCGSCALLKVALEVLIGPALLSVILTQSSIYEYAAIAPEVRVISLSTSRPHAKIRKSVLARLESYISSLSMKRAMNKLQQRRLWVVVYGEEEECLVGWELAEGRLATAAGQSKEWQDNADGTTPMTDVLALLCSNLAGILPSSPPQVVLDPCCGTAATLAALGHRALGLGGDVDAHLVHAAAENNPNTSLIIANVSHWPWRAGIADAIICDPPYGVRAEVCLPQEQGRQDTLDARHLWQIVVERGKEAVVPGGKIVLLLPLLSADDDKFAPSTTSVSALRSWVDEVARRLGLLLLHILPEERRGSLKRAVVVLQKPLAKEHTCSSGGRPSISELESDESSHINPSAVSGCLASSLHSIGVNNHTNTSVASSCPASIMHSKSHVTQKDAHTSATDKSVLTAGFSGSQYICCPTRGEIQNAARPVPFNVDNRNVSCSQRTDNTSTTVAVSGCMSSGVGLSKPSTSLASNKLQGKAGPPFLQDERPPLSDSQMLRGSASEALQEVSGPPSVQEVEADMVPSFDVEAECSSSGSMEVCGAHASLLRNQSYRIARSTLSGLDIDVWRSAWMGDLQSVRRYLEAGGSPNVADRHGCTPLHFAAGYARISCIKALTDAGADPNAGDRKGGTPLMRAASRGHAGAVKLLLQAGSVIPIVDGGGATALHHAAQFGHSDVIEAMVAHLKVTNGRARTDEVTYLAPSGVKSLDGQNLDLKHLRSHKDQGMTTAHCMEVGDVKTAQCLIGSHIESEEWIEEIEANLAVAESLLGAGSVYEGRNMRQLNKYVNAQCPEPCVISEGGRCTENSGLVSVSTSTKVELGRLNAGGEECDDEIAGGGNGVDMLWKRAVESALDQTDSQGYTALHRAARWGHARTIQVLLSYGASPVLRSQKGVTAGQLAAKWGHVEAVKVLEESQAVKN